MDNASVNDVLARKLAQLLLKRYQVSFAPENAQIHCVAHVVNLIVQKILSNVLDIDDPALADYYELYNKHLPIHYDLADDEDLKQWETEGSTSDSVGNQDEEDANASDIEDELGGELQDFVSGNFGNGSKAAVDKLRLIVKKIVSSPQRRARFRRTAQRVYSDNTDQHARLRKLMVVRDVATRWNYTHAMIERACLLRKVINQWVMDSDDATQQLFLTVQEWDMLGKIASLLEVFTKVTKEMSRSGTPTLPYALPMYERMRKCLVDHARDEKVSPDIRNAAAAGLEKLLEYYDLAKASQYTILATMLHPSLRLNWLTSVYGDDCREGYRALFTHVYTTYEAASLNAQTPPPAPPTQADNSDFLSEVCTVQRIPHRDIGSDDATQRVFSAMEEIDRYLRGEGGSGTFHDPLKWWREKQGAFPVIARMARDFLAIPATSVAVERLFSSSRHLCTDVRASFKAETITEAMCVKYWIRNGLLKVESPAPPRRQ